MHVLTSLQCKPQRIHLCKGEPTKSGIRTALEHNRHGLADQRGCAHVSKTTIICQAYAAILQNNTGQNFLSGAKQALLIFTMRCACEAKLQPGKFARNPTQLKPDGICFF